MFWLSRLDYFRLSPLVLVSISRELLRERISIASTSFASFLKLPETTSRNGGRRCWIWLHSLHRYTPAGREYSSIHIGKQSILCFWENHCEIIQGPKPSSSAYSTTGSPRTSPPNKGLSSLKQMTSPVGTLPTSLRSASQPPRVSHINTRAKSTKSQSRTALRRPRQRIKQPHSH